MTSDEAVALLGVRKATLYTYVSRGVLRSRSDGGRGCHYLADDVERLAARTSARKGHGAVAAGALRWGEPVLDSAITAVENNTLRYRGKDVVTLALEGASFESVADLLWSAPAGEPWPACPVSVAPSRLPGVWRWAELLPSMALADPGRHGASPEAERDRARRIIVTLASSLCRRDLSDDRVAKRVCAAWRLPRRHAPLIDRALVLCADHELNASTFAARVAASAGADLYACLGAALNVFTAPLHGGAAERVEALLDDVPARRVDAWLRERLSRGEALLGFGHRLYPDGDPRAPALLDALPAGGDRRRRAALRALIPAVESLTGQRPTVDLALVALTTALGLPSGSATTLFALGRSAGWAAHVMEQRESRGLLRPRARYVGPRP